MSHRPRALRYGFGGAVGPVLVLGIAAAIALFVHALAHANVNPDAGTYLTTVERAAEGWVPYRDLQLAYTPLALAMLLGLRVVGGPEIGYAIYLAFVMALTVVNAGLVFVLARRVGARALVAGGAALLFLLGSYAYDGVYLVLEPFTVFFALASLLLAFAARNRPWALLLAGAAAGCAFLTKQYGLAALPPVAAYVVMARPTWGTRVRGLAAVGLGFVGPFVLLFGTYALLFGVAPGDLARSWLGQSYARWGWEPGMARVWAFLWPQHIYLLLLPILLFGGRVRRAPEIAAVFLAVLLFAAPLYVRAYRHYFLLVIPFLVVLGSAAAERGLRRRAIRPLVAATALLSLLLTAVDAHRLFEWQTDFWDRPAQRATANALNRHIPRQAPVLVLGNHAQWMNYLGDFASPAPRTLGYSFPSALSRQARRDLIARGHPAVVTPRSIERNPDWLDLLEAEGFAPTETPSEGVEIWSRVP